MVSGGLLTLTGFLSFMITGSTSGIRFGVILGGTLLALGIYSLRSWKKGKSSSVALKGQAGLYLTLIFYSCNIVLYKYIYLVSLMKKF